uniref:Uncharacterized protein n=1 Tax=Strix occidentalis caurina TaxID=311401 RepID=A0A8D0FVU6_STROC
MVCFNSFYQAYQHKLKLALIGQSIFGQEVYNKLRKEGHKVVGVFTVPDKNGQADPLGKTKPSVTKQILWNHLNCNFFFFFFSVAQK